MGSREEYPEVIPGVGDEVAAAVDVYWVCTRDRVHKGRATPLPRDHARAVYSAVVPVPAVAGDPFESGCGCPGDPQEGLRGVVPGEVSWEGPALALQLVLGLGMEGVR